jgi:hypothetical protein
MDELLGEKCIGDGIFSQIIGESALYMQFCAVLGTDLIGVFLAIARLSSRFGLIAGGDERGDKALLFDGEVLKAVGEVGMNLHGPRDFFSQGGV